MLPCRGVDERKWASWATDLGVGLKAVPDGLVEARSPEDITTGEDHSPVGLAEI